MERESETGASWHCPGSPDCAKICSVFCPLGTRKAGEAPALPGAVPGMRPSETGVVKSEGGRERRVGAPGLEDAYVAERSGQVGGYHQVQVINALR